jgi:hypothetical protein
LNDRAGELVALHVAETWFLTNFLFAVRKDWTVVIILTVFLLIETGSLIVFTRMAIQNGWARSDW